MGVGAWGSRGQILVLSCHLGVPLSFPKVTLGICSQGHQQCTAADRWEGQRTVPTSPTPGRTSMALPHFHQPQEASSKWWSQEGAKGNLDQQPVA